MSEINYFAANGAVVIGLGCDSDTYRVSVVYGDARSSVTVEVDTDTDWDVDHPPTWLHTAAEAEAVDALAREALAEYFQTLA